MRLEKGTPEYQKAKRQAEALAQEGVSPSIIEVRTGLKRNQIAGILHRTRQKTKKKARPQKERGLRLVYVNPAPPVTEEEREMYGEIIITSLTKHNWKPKGELRPFNWQTPNKKRQIVRHRRAIERRRGASAHL